MLILKTAMLFSHFISCFSVHEERPAIINQVAPSVSGKLAGKGKFIFQVGFAPRLNNSGISLSCRYPPECWARNRPCCSWRCSAILGILLDKRVSHLFLLPLITRIMTLTEFV